MTPKEIAELRAKRNGLVEQCRGIANTAAAEKRSLTGEEQTQYNKIWTDQRALGDQIKREEELLEAERETLGGEGKREREEREHQERGGGQGENAAAKNWGIRAMPNYGPAFDNFLRTGKPHSQTRDMSLSEGAKGGFLAHQAFINQLIKAQDNILYFRQVATKFLVAGASSLGCPSLDTDIGDADWTAEVPASELSADSSMAFGNRDFTPHMLAKLVKASRKLINNPMINSQDIIINNLAYKNAVTQEKGFMTGNGVGRPLGVFTASNNGIGTSRDIATGNTSTSITFAGLKNAKYGIKKGYRANSQWLMHRDGVSQVAGLTDDSGQFLWQPSKAMGEPDLLMGHAIMESEYAPNTFTTGQYVGLFGDFSHYWIADSMDVEIQILLELFASKNQIGYICRSECDGMPVLGEAFSRIKLA